MRLKSIPLVIFLLIGPILLPSSYAQSRISIGAVETGDSGTARGYSGFLKHKTYYNLIWQQIRNAWVGPKSLKGVKNLETIIAIQIARDGRVVDIYIEKTSGNLELDNSALRAIIKANPFPPLPPDFKGDKFDLGVRFTPSAP